MATETPSEPIAEETTPPDAPEQVASPAFRSQLGAEWVLGPAAFAVVAVLCGIFLMLNYVTLRGTDLWLHVNYGEWILEAGQLPHEEVFAPLASGMPLMNASWLSQVIFALVNAQGGAHALSFLFAATTFASYVLLARTFYLQTNRASMILVGLAIAIVAGWSRIATIRPENFAFLAFALLLWLIFGRRPQTNANGAEAVSLPEPGWKLWIAIPVIMALWANLHGSFFVGLGLLGCCCLGRFIEAGWSSRSFLAAISDRAAWRWLFLTQVAAAATLLNPHGIDLWIYTLGFSSKENLQGILEWQPLFFAGVGGREFTLSLVLLMVVLRLSRRPFSATQILLLASFGAAPLLGNRFLTWYGAVLAVVLVPHLAEILGRLLPVKSEEPENAPEGDDTAPRGVWAWRYSLLSGLAIWIAFAMSPASHPLLGTKLRSPEQLYEAESTPLKLTAYLKENPPQGQVYHPQAWGDWLQREVGPAFQPFVTSNIHVTPRQVWTDYLIIFRQQPGWEATLDRYLVNTLIVNKEQQPRFKAVIRNNTDWNEKYEDDDVIVYQRKRPAPATKPAADANTAAASAG